MEIGRYLEAIIEARIESTQVVWQYLFASFTWTKYFTQNTIGFRLAKHVVFV